MSDPAATRYPVSLTIPQWESVQAAIDTAAGQATDAGDPASRAMWQGLQQFIGSQLP